MAYNLIIAVQAFDHTLRTEFIGERVDITDGAVGVKNADILCNPIINRDSDITPATLSASFAKVRSQLRNAEPDVQKGR